MPNPETLPGAAALAQDLHDAAKQKARAGLAAAREALAESRGRLADRTAALAGTEKRIARKRAEIAASEVPANAEAMLAELERLLVESRALQAEILEHAEEAGEAEAGAEAAASALARAEAGLTAAKAAAREAAASGAARTAWKAAATEGPLAALAGPAGDAAGTLAGPEFSAARSRIEADLPVEMLAAARAAYEAAVGRIEELEAATSAAEDRLAAGYAAREGERGAVKAGRIRIRRAERAIREWAERGMERYERARTRLRDVAGASSLLTPAESARLAALGGDDGDSDEAAIARAEREEKRAAAGAAQAAYDDARLAVLARNATVDDDAIADDDDVTAAKDALDDALGELAAAVAAYDGVHAKFAAWSAAVPESAWRGVLGFLEAERTLNDLKDVDPQGLVDDLAAAEAALSGALADAERGAFTLAFLEAEVAAREGRLARARAGRQPRLTGAVRGDA